MIDSRNLFFPQADLMIECLPVVFMEDCFALKGGTAINLFYRDLPRLSVDIDLVYLPLKSFEEAQSEISKALDRIATQLEKKISRSKALKSQSKDGSFTQKLNLQLGSHSVVIEPNIVLRGALDSVQKRTVIPSVESLFQKSAAGQVLSEEEVYAGKFCAALDRQHPRDLFDVKIFLESKKIDSKMRALFIAYLLCGGRPIHEILFPSLAEISQSYERDFKQMTYEVVPLKELLDTREKFISLLHASLSSDDKKFILSFDECEPDWALLSVAHANVFPAIEWKLKNLTLLKTSNPLKYAKQHNALLEKIGKI